ncbi:unnamed protein product [marine sediment metagenome]|uniref:Uncharacterized protein n=1 Tax=marine sediment metagenome TaxID=412755 RepID=X1P7H9_9ZZZZ
MIYCFQCPLKDKCSVPKVETSEPSLELKFNWLPDGAESQCPLYRLINTPKIFSIIDKMKEGYIEAAKEAEQKEVNDKK